MNVLKKIFVVGCVTLMSMSAGVAVSSNGCDKEENDRINPILALCSTHVYNVGEATNPNNESGRQMMRDAIALKTTLINQQMNQQYEYLESMIRRFKTQLQKAVLTASLQAAGAPSESASSSSGTKVQMGENCSGKNRTDTVYCLRSNYSKLSAAISSNQFTNEVKDQMVMDANAIQYFDSSLAENLCEGTAKPDDKCCWNKKYLNKTTMPACLGKINGAIVKMEEGGQRQSSGMGFYGMR